MTFPQEQSATALWKAPPSTKSKNLIQRAVTALFDDLAPERGLKQSEAPQGPVEQHRTPSGCVLQAEKAAVSVSWFSGAGNDPSLGELRVLVWRGVVSRRGAPQRREGATVVSEMVVYPVEDASNERVWRAADGAKYSTTALAAACTKLLDQQVLIES
ncbi:MAG TPA: hypothetical protein VJ840_15435 [Gemmatimonadaceae bacterium]|nr:hypothetical protein [Gemmatimonadaceae bacterium]